jgi:hypothetical protein
MSFLLDQIALRVAVLVPITPAPTGDLGFGSDLSCVDDITSDAAELSGSDPLLVAQAAYRRLITARGALPDDADYGLDVRGMFGKALTRQAQIEIPGRVRAELEKDDRIVPETLQITITPTGGLAHADFDLDVQGETALGPFSLTLALTDAGALLKEIRGNGNIA